MKFNAEITAIKSSRGRKTMTIALAPNVSLDQLDAYSDQLCEFEIGLNVEVETGVEVDAFTGEVLE